MGLVEIVFEVERPDDPLVRFCSQDPKARAMLRLVELTPPAMQAIVTAVGSSEMTAPLVRELRQQAGVSSFEILSVTPYSVVMKIGAGLSGVKLPWAEIVDAVHNTFGREMILEPIMAEDGWLRIRALAVRDMDTRRALEKLQELQRSLTGTGFRVVRVTEFNPVEMSERLVPLLDPDQEELVRLALSMGYYESPRRCNLEDIARRVGLSVSPVHKKLKDVEHTLINSYLDPGSRKERRRRRHVTPLDRPENGGVFREVTLQATVPGGLAEFTALHPNARAIFQPLQDASGKGTTSLLVAVGTPAQYHDLMKQLEAEGAGLEVLSQDQEHVSLRVSGRWAGIDAVLGLVRRFGRDAYPKPTVADSGRLLIRFVLTKRVPDAEIAKAVEEVAQESRWQSHEVVTIRDVSVETSLLGLPRPEKVTPRQDEVLRIGHALGYYRTPRDCTLEDIASTLGISTNAVHKNMTAAEQKIIYNYVASGL